MRRRVPIIGAPPSPRVDVALLAGRASSSGCAARRVIVSYHVAAAAVRYGSVFGVLMGVRAMTQALQSLLPDVPLQAPSGRLFPRRSAKSPDRWGGNEHRKTRQRSDLLTTVERARSIGPLLQQARVQGSHCRGGHTVEVIPDSHANTTGSPLKYGGCFGWRRIKMRLLPESSI
jgi:hypothetical protein